MSESLRAQGCPQGRTAPRQEPWAWLLIAACAESEDCVVWPYTSNGTSGYPVLGGGRYAHRLACEWTHGPCPVEGWTASHLCGTKLCVNGKHLRWESMADNLARSPHAVRRGEDHPAAKLRADQVVEMRARWAAGGITQRALAAQYGIHQTTCGDIVSGREWSWLA